MTTSYGQNDLSDARIKQNVRDADLEELQAIFDGVALKRYDRADADDLFDSGLRQAHRRAVGRLQAAARPGRGAEGEEESP